jgi:HPr kinase/phosphorylase
MHGTCVDLKGSGILIVGRSGSGKSSLAVGLLALGASLVADDQCVLVSKNDRIQISKPASLPNSIEMRGIGLVSVPIIIQTNLDWVVNLDEVETERMPNRKFTNIRGCRIPTIFGKNMDDLASRIYVLVTSAVS